MFPNLRDIPRRIYVTLLYKQILKHPLSQAEAAALKVLHPYFMDVYTRNLRAALGLRRPT